MASGVVLPPGTAARSPTAVVPLHRDDWRPGQDHR
jgi:hypothetical protein